jgi:hypothetical protein
MDLFSGHSTAVCWSFDQSTVSNTLFSPAIPEKLPSKSARQVNPLKLDPSKFAEVGVWCSLPAALSTRPIAPRHPQLHVHLRAEPGGPKLVDRDFAAISVPSGRSDQNLEGESKATRVDVTPVVAFDYLRALVSGRELDGVSSPLKKLSDQFLKTSGTIVPNRSLNLADYAGCDYSIWASTPALLWTSDRAQEQGIHVHVMKNGKYVVDETFGQVLLDGKPLARQALLEMMFQRASCE